MKNKKSNTKSSEVSAPVKTLTGRLLDEIKFIRRKNRLAKYKPRKKKTPFGGIHSRNKRMANGRPLSLFPSPNQSPEFKKILKYFIQPLIDNASLAGMALEQKLDILFCTATRDIVPAVFIHEVVTMPGQVVQEDGLRRPPTISEAKFAAGTPVFVRIDDVNKLKVEIESCEKPDLLFELNIVEYKSVLDKLREIEGCNYRLDPPGEIREKNGSFTAVI